MQIRSVFFSNADLFPQKKMRYNNLERGETMAETYYLAVDIGASSGRHILGHTENGKIVLEEIYRFENGLIKKNGHLLSLIHISEPTRP